MLLTALPLNPRQDGGSVESNPPRRIDAHGRNFSHLTPARPRGFGDFRRSRNRLADFRAPAAARGPDGIADVAEAVIDAVVNVSTKQTVDMSSDAMPQLPPGSPFEEFFEEFFKNQHGQSGEHGAPQPRRVNSLGSGFIIDPSGIVVTNNHVIADADEITSSSTTAPRSRPSIDRPRHEDRSGAAQGQAAASRSRR